MVKGPKSENITWHAGKVTRQAREQKRGHRGATLWFTGLSGSGKSTLAGQVEEALLARGVVTYVLDGDNIRHGLNRDLGFAQADRVENIRRIGEVARLFTDATVIVLCAFISPYREDRNRIRAAMGPGDFVEVHVQASLATCEQRDPKGLYKKARAGEITDMTGIGDAYEPPLHPELLIDSENATPLQNVATVLAYLEQHGYIPAQTVNPTRPA